MKTWLTVLLLTASLATAADTPPAFLFEQGARRVEADGAGYILTMPDNRRVYVRPTGTGYVSSSAGKLTYYDRTGTGWVRSNPGGRAQYYDASSPIRPDPYRVRVTRPGSQVYYSAGKTDQKRDWTAHGIGSSGPTYSQR